MTQPVLSIVITAYNQEESLPRCLYSILDSGLKEYEVVVIDDFSDDQTAAICQEFAGRYPQVRTKRLSRNSGPGAARNVGAEYARGQFLYFVDGDDTIVSSMMGQLLDLLKMNPAVDIVAANHIVVTSSSRKVRSLILSEENFMTSDFLSRYWFMLATPLWQFLYNRRFFLRSGIKIPETYNMEDMCFTAYSLFISKSVYAFPGHIYEYHAGGRNSLSSTANYEHNLAGFKACCAMLQSVIKRNAWPVSYLKYSLRKFIVNMMSITEPNKEASVFHLAENEPSVKDYHHDRAEEFIQEWGFWFCGKLLRAAQVAEKLVFIAPAGKLAYTLVKWIERAGGEVGGILDNNPSSKNTNFHKCRELGYEMMALESIRELGNCFPVVFCFDGELARVLTDQLINMGLEHDKDFFAVYGAFA